MAALAQNGSSGSSSTLQEVSPSPPTRPKQYTASKQRFAVDLSQCLFDFVIQLLPTAEEMSVKEDVRKLLERLIRTIEPDSRLLSFGSTANGFSLRNSDMDLCCLIDAGERLSASDLVTMLGDLLERETKFHVKPLPHARIPIVKLSLDPSPGLPLGIACDIGFENRLALENTRLLMCYAMIDPTRVRTLVLFLKVWSKRRKINSPYKGTLSSYGYVLLVIYFLVHVKNPPVLPNLQQMPPLRPISKEDTHLSGYNTWFFDDIDLLRQHWHSENTETVAELLIDFFKHYARDFLYNNGVASIRAGLLKKESKGWQNELSGPRYADSRERNRLCIEDPFELDFNVARCVTKDGLYTIRGEFMRASRILQLRPERAIVALAELCEERKEEDLVSAPPYHNGPPPRPPPQTPYTVGSSSLRQKPASALPQERFSPPTMSAAVSEQSQSPKASAAKVSIRSPPPEHMAPRRSKWTSPPPPEAPSSAHQLFENQLGAGLELATASTAARELEKADESSASEIYTDDDGRSDAAESDDVHSIRSFTEGTNTSSPGPASGSSGQRRPSFFSPVSVPAGVTLSADTKLNAQARGRFYRPPPNASPTPLSKMALSSSSNNNMNEAGPSTITSKRSSSGPPRTLNGMSWLAPTPQIAAATPLPPSPDSPSSPHFAVAGTSSSSMPEHQNATVFYQTNKSNRTSPPTSYHRSPAAPVLYTHTHTMHGTPPPAIVFNAGQHNHPHAHFQQVFHHHHSSPHHQQAQQYHLNHHGQPFVTSSSSSSNIPHDVFPSSLPSISAPLPSAAMNPFLDNRHPPRRQQQRQIYQAQCLDQHLSGPDTPTPTSFGATATHTPSHSVTTVTGGSSPPHSPKRSPQQTGAGNGLSKLTPSSSFEGSGQNSPQSPSRRKPSPAELAKISAPREQIPVTGSDVQEESNTENVKEHFRKQSSNGSSSPHMSSSISSSSRVSRSSASAGSPTSSISTGYATSMSRSPSPSPHDRSSPSYLEDEGEGAQWPTTPTTPPVTATPERLKAPYSNSSLATLKAPEEEESDLTLVEGSEGGKRGGDEVGKTEGDVAAPESVVTVDVLGHGKEDKVDR